jgi:SPP1 family predicted phage head-tail adaptor
MRAGQLRHRVVFERPTSAQNETGEIVGDFELAFTVWARIVPVRGSEAMRAGQVLADMDTRIFIRSGPLAAQINAKWRASHRGVLYNLVSVAEVEMAGQEVEIMAKSGLNRG